MLGLGLGKFLGIENSKFLAKILRRRPRKKIQFAEPLPREQSLESLLRGFVCPVCHSPVTPDEEMEKALGGNDTSDTPHLTCNNCSPPARFRAIGGEVVDFRSGRAREDGDEFYKEKEKAVPPRWKKAIKYVFAFPIWAVILLVIFLYRLRYRSNKGEKLFSGFLESGKIWSRQRVFHFYHKLVEIFHFSNHIPEPPSLEFGGGTGVIANIIYGGRARVTYGSEFLAETFEGERLPENMYNVFDCIFSSEAYQYPLRDGALRTVYSVHILDHISDVDKVFSEVSRVLEPGGVFFASTYIRHFELPEFPVLRFFGFLSERYKWWRYERANPRGGGTPYVSDGYYPTGRNIMSEDDWRELSGRYGFELTKTVSYTRPWLYGLILDFEHQDFRCPKSFLPLVFRLLVPICAHEAENPLPYKEATNGFFVFRKRT